MARQATLYRMVMDKHVCPFGLKARDLLRREGFVVDDHWLRTREETDAFKAEHGVRTTPQVFIDGERIGGYDDLRRHLGRAVADPKAVTYKPVIAVFVMTALMALAASHAAYGSAFTVRAGEWFIAFSMCVLAILKLQNVETFSSMFLGYDLLARRWVPYAYLYAFAEALAGVLMIAGVLTWLAVPLALVIGGVGAVSVFKAVYLEKRELKCACVGGGSNVPLGFVSLTENVMMVAMALWMLVAMTVSGWAQTTTPSMPQTTTPSMPQTTTPSIPQTTTPSMPGMQMDAARMTSGPAQKGSADQAFMAGMTKMDHAMQVPMTGDADRDFVAMMIPHHQGAIDMAEVELKYGKDPMLRQLATDIVKAQEHEIATMKAWQAKHAR